MDHLEVRVSCSGRCPVSADVTIDADKGGYDAATLSVNCVKGTTLTLDELRGAVGDAFAVVIRPRRGARDMLFGFGGPPFDGGHGRELVRPLPPGGPTFDEPVEPPTDRAGQMASG